MTAVAPPVNFQNINRQAWSAEGVPNGGAIFLPRSAKRSNSSSSLSSQASTTSTISASSSQTNVSAPPNSAEAAAWAARKTKAPKGLWPATKTEPVAGITTARPQPVASASTGSSAASAMSALQTPSAMVPSQHNAAVQAQQQNGAPRQQAQESAAVLHLVPMNGTFERKTITVPFFPDVLRIGRQTNNKTIPTPLNGYFDSKVLSRQHAEVWADRNGKIWIRDVKSSNGTFVNGARLSQENRDSDPHELREQDMLELGIDIVSEDQKTIVHHKVAARVEHAGIYARTSNEMIDLNFGELEGPQLANMMGGGQQQLANMRGRTPSQGSMNGQRLQGPGAVPNYPNGMQQPRHPNFWLQPITMEQVVKKLNAEIKAAKQQSQELQQTHHYINNILAADPKKEALKASPVNPVRISPIKDINLKTRFSDPPAPPPQQPLPEKPDAATSLRRSDTERPKTGSPVRSDAQMSSLNEALTSAKKEIELQGIRLRDLESLLNEERRAREEAEERASRLERESAKEQGEMTESLANGHTNQTETEDEHEEVSEPQNESASRTETEDSTALLQQRLDLMLTEMNEMKQQMERYRERAENAEADRKTLAEMVETIRNDNARSASKEARRRRRSDSERAQAQTPAGTDGSEDDEAEEGEITIIREKELEEDGPEASLPAVAPQNGHAVEQNGTTHASKAANGLVTQRSNRDLMYHGGPVGAIVTVVAIGVAVMAMLNQYPKADR